MLKSIINVYVLILLFKIIKAQIDLTQDILDQVCNCRSSQSKEIYLSDRDIATIYPFTFNGLNSLKKLYIDENLLTSLDPYAFFGEEFSTLPFSLLNKFLHYYQWKSQLERNSWRATYYFR